MRNRSSDCQTPAHCPTATEGGEEGGGGGGIIKEGVQGVPTERFPNLCKKTRGFEQIKQGCREV